MRTRVHRPLHNGTPALSFRAVSKPYLDLDNAAWPQAEFLEKHVAYYVIGADVWRYVDTLDMITTRFESAIP
jgi:hypothetical protein